jgi:Heavy metal binding domain
MKSISLKLFVLAVLLGSPACSKYSKLIKPSDVDYYTCTMHPSVHAEAPGNCPICGMDLVPVMKKDSSISAAASAGGGSMQGMSGLSGMPGMQDANTNSSCRSSASNKSESLTQR